MARTHGKLTGVIRTALAVSGTLHAAPVEEADVRGDVTFPTAWTVFVYRDEPDPNASLRELSHQAKARTKANLETLPEGSPDILTRLPASLTVNGRTLHPVELQAKNHQLDLRPLLGEPPFPEGVVPAPDYTAWGQAAFVFVPITAATAQEVTLGFGVDAMCTAWLNGERILDTRDADSPSWPPAITDHILTVPFRDGINLLAVRYISGKGCSILALGGPRALRAGNFKSIVADPLLLGDARWTRETLAVAPGQKRPIDIGDRRELFVDAHLVDGMSGDAELRLHRPVPREIVLELNKPWEGPICTFFSVVETDDKIRLYYSGRGGNQGQAACVAESDDGIHFSRPCVGLYDFNGSTSNNIVWRKGASGHNFTPFRDTNPDAPADQQFKAIAYHPNGGGLGAYASAAGIEWRMLADHRVITKGGFDSQNQAFWDPLRACYVDYHRGSGRTGPMRGVRDIMTATSTDFLQWSEPELIVYDDSRGEHMYINCIRPYARAPHIYIGTPARFVPQFKKVPAHPTGSISDVILMSSRDGKHFHRWEEAFIRPGTDPEVWTDRNNYPATGLVQTSPEELSLYWTEHYRHPTLRLRRGTLRLDGFVSLHAGADVGELLTRPFTFSGRRLEVNYATSAGGMIRFELCDAQGRPIQDFALADSDLLFGNELARTVTWNTRHDLRRIAGRQVRLRVRLRDADLYSFRFPTADFNQDHTAAR